MNHSSWLKAPKLRADPGNAGKEILGTLSPAACHKTTQYAPISLVEPVKMAKTT